SKLREFYWERKRWKPRNVVRKKDGKKFSFELTLAKKSSEFEILKGDGQSPNAKCLLALLLPGQSHLRRFHLLLDLALFFLINFRSHGFVPLLKGTLPVGGGQLQASGFLVEIAEMLLNRWVSPHVL